MSRRRAPDPAGNPGQRFATPFTERERDECVYLLGHGYQADVCGAPVRHEGEPYCPWHMAACYVPTNRMSASSPVREANVAKREKAADVEEGSLFDAPDSELLTEDAE